MKENHWNCPECNHTETHDDVQLMADEAADHLVRKHDYEYPVTVD